MNTELIFTIISIQGRHWPRKLRKKEKQYISLHSCKGTSLILGEVGLGDADVFQQSAFSPFCQGEVENDDTFEKLLPPSAGHGQYLTCSGILSFSISKDSGFRE